MEFISLSLSALILLSLSAILSGLNIALLTLDLGTLHRKAKLGDKHALKVLPLRQNVHLTLASILLANVAFATSLPLVLNSSLSGISAGIISTIALVIFGEILPQAFFARHALRLYAIFWLPLRIIIALTYPLSKPLQLLLDKLVGKHGIQLHTRHELGVLVGEHLDISGSELDEDEVEIMRGALMLSEKRVKEIMTPIKSVYWLQPDSIINGRTIAEIQAKSWSRIPVFNNKLTECAGVLLMKDLVNINFVKHPVRVQDLPLHPTQLVGRMTALDTLFRKFIKGHTHLIPVEKDDIIIGIVTIEDLLEEIVGHEIIDEVDHRIKRT